MRQNERQESHQSYAERQEARFGRLAEYSLDEENKRLYEARRRQWGRVLFKTRSQTTEEYAELQRFKEGFNAVKSAQVVEVLRKDSAGWTEKLTDFERKAVQKYTFNPGDKKPNRLFEQINAMLRRDLPSDAKLQMYADGISGAVEKFDLQHNVIAYRRMDFDMIAGSKVGEVIVSDQFLSTSVIESRALPGSYSYKIYVRKGSRAAYVERISSFPKQRELLLDKGTVVRVLSKQGNFAELEVLT